VGGAASQNELARIGAAALIAADVGGTHARLALFDPARRGADDFAILHYRKYACAEFPSLAAIVEQFRASVGGGDVTEIAIALAGTVVGDAVVNENLLWPVSVSGLKQALGASELAIVNDFEAVAHAIGHVDANDATLLCGPTQAAHGPILIVGPGTGLGAALRIPSAPHALVLATEAGQATLAPDTDYEIEIVRELRRSAPRVQIERVISGTGLMNLYRAISNLRGTAAVLGTPAEITAAAASGNDVIARETTDVFCGWLGSVLGDLALIYGAQGGIYLAGGVLPQMKDLLIASGFVSRFLDKGAMRPVLERLPVRLIEHAQLGVIGAASWYLDHHRARRIRDARATSRA